VHRSIVKVCSSLLDLQIYVLRKKSDLKKRGKSLCFDKRNISDLFCFESMNLSVFNIFYPSLLARSHLKEIFDRSKVNRNEERYVIPMHRKSFWTNKWVHEPRKMFCRVQVQHYDPSA
jgi:hypothetical protein